LGDVDALAHAMERDLLIISKTLELANKAQASKSLIPPTEQQTA
jgi:hypothetical protein